MLRAFCSCPSSVNGSPGSGLSTPDLNDRGFCQGAVATFERTRVHTTLAEVVHVLEKQRIFRGYLILIPRLRIVGVCTLGVWISGDRQQLVDGIGGVALVCDMDAVGFPLVSDAPVERVDDMFLSPGVCVGADLLPLEFCPEAGKPVALLMSDQDLYHSAPFLRYLISYPVESKTTLRPTTSAAAAKSPQANRAQYGCLLYGSGYL